VRLVVLGDPVAHSLSPTIHQAALDAVGIPGTYQARRVDAAGMEAAVRNLRHGVLDGANVTMPHKALAAGLADRLEPTARRAGAVNTLVRVDRSIVGHNTDVGGVRTVWGWAGLSAAAPVLVLGAGGASAAALLALEGRRLHIAARRAEAAASLVGDLGVDAQVTSWGSGVAGAVVVNGTPLGMAGETLPARVLDGAGGLLEMAYGSGPTPAATTMAAAGLPVASGPEMLLAQGALSFELWTGRKAPVESMRRAMEAEMARRHATREV
jgi:shikimate dehydrogenase